MSTKDITGILTDKVFKKKSKIPTLVLGRGEGWSAALLPTRHLYLSWTVTGSENADKLLAVTPQQRALPRMNQTEEKGIRRLFSSVSYSRKRCIGQRLVLWKQQKLNKYSY